MRKSGFILSLIIFSLIIFSGQLHSQDRLADNIVLPESGKIKGKVIEDGSKLPLEYATVAVYFQEDSAMANGSITNQKGQFIIEPLEPGKYYVDIRYMGYVNHRRTNVVINQDVMTIDLGVVALKPATENISEVTITSQNKAIAYDLDKKVIDPSFFPTAANGTAIDILALTPSVTVDIEGNVALRGSTGFTVLIDGKPTPFEAADALQQIPASTIRNIEIITNPSAKYDPDGNAGIININTKKSRLQGFSGIVNATGDTYGSLSGDVLLNYRYGKFNFFVSGNRSDRKGEGTSEMESMTIEGDTSYTNSFGEGRRGRASFSAKGGFDYNINDYNSLTFNVDLNGRSSDENGKLDFEEFNSAGHLLRSLTNTISTRNGNSVALSLDYNKTFKREGQSLTGYILYESGSSEEKAYFEQFDNDETLITGMNSWEVGPAEKEFRVKLDYIHPFAGNKKLETGYQSRMESQLEWNDRNWFSTENSNYEPSPSSPYYTDIDFSEDIHSLYGTFSNSNSIFGYQLGLRTEYTNRLMTYTGSDQDYEINRLDYFPSLHFSLTLPREQQMIASYSRRIDRPRGFYLEPFITYEDAYNVRMGNPAILPEYIDSYELGYQKQLKKEGFLSAEAYFRQTNNKTERVQSVFQPNVMMRSIANIGTDYSLGIELMFNNKPLKWWTLNLMGNIYNYRLEGEFEGREINTSSNNWNSRFNNTFMLGETTRLQADVTYYSPTVSAQGRREGFLFTNMAVRQDFFSNKLSATLGVRDVLNTAKFEYTSEGYNFRSYRKFDMKSPVITLTLSYRINNFKPQQQRGENDGDGIMDGDGEM